MGWMMHLDVMMTGGGKLVMWLVFLLAVGIQGYVETEEFISDLDKPGENILVVELFHFTWKLCSWVLPL